MTRSQQQVTVTEEYRKHATERASGLRARVDKLRTAITKRLGSNFNVVRAIRDGRNEQ